MAVQEKSPPQLSLLSTSGGKSRELPNPGFKEYHYGSWFPDGRRILFTAVEARQDAFLSSYVQDIETGVVQPLTEEGTVALRVSPDGKKLVVRDAYGGYYIRPVDGGAAETTVEGLEPDEEPIQWTGDGRAFYVMGSGDSTTKVYRIEIATGPGGVAITPDGKVCVYTYWTVTQELLLMQ